MRSSYHRRRCRHGRR